MKKLLARYSKKIRGVLSCFDRVIIMGTLPDICYAAKMEWQLRSRGIRIFDYTKYVEPMREKIRENAERVARENGAHVGDTFMSLIYSAEIESVDPFDYLTELLRHPEELRRSPQDWMPWNYQTAVAAAEGRSV